MKDFFENNKTMILFVLVPAICLLGIIIVTQQISKDKDAKSDTSVLNTSMLEKKDSIYSSRAAAYDDKNKQAQEAKDKADFGTNTDVNFKMNDSTAKVGGRNIGVNTAAQKSSLPSDNAGNDAASIIAESDRRRVQNQKQQARNEISNAAEIEKQVDGVDDNGAATISSSKKHGRSKASHAATATGSALPVVAGGNGFQNLDFDGSTVAAKDTKGKNIIHASVLRSVRLVAGQDVTIRTTESGSVGGIVIPRNSIISGITQMGANRLMVRVTGVNIGGEPTSLQMSVFDQDGMEGIRAPGSAAGSAATQSVNDQVDAVDGAVAGHAGIIGLISGAGGSLVKAVRGNQKTFLPEGYKVTLMFSSL